MFGRKNRATNESVDFEWSQFIALCNSKEIEVGKNRWIEYYGTSSCVSLLSCCKTNVVPTRQQVSDSLSWQEFSALLPGSSSAHHHMHLLLPCVTCPQTTEPPLAAPKIPDLLLQLCAPIILQSACRDGLHLDGSWHQHRIVRMSWRWARSSQSPCGLRLWWQWTPGPQDSVLVGSDNMSAVSQVHHGRGSSWLLPLTWTTPGWSEGHVPPVYTRQNSNGFICGFICGWIKWIN